VTGPVDQEDLPAGNFSQWLHGMQAALRGERSSDVPCEGCTACCRSSQFVHVGPEETETLSRIPVELRFPAPRMPAGHVVLGYDEQGRCPMLIGDRCSIYAHRPQACRTYDCRVFPAAGVDPDDEQALIAERAKRWRFDFSSDDDRAVHAAVSAAAVSIGQRGPRTSEEPPPVNATQLAVAAIEGVSWV